MTSEIEIGSVVWLKSGSPPMTVVSEDRYQGKKVLSVTWIDGLAIQTSSFLEVCLQLVEPNFKETE